MTRPQFLRFCDGAVEYGQSSRCTVVRTKYGAQITDRADRLTWTLRWARPYDRGYFVLRARRHPAFGPPPSFTTSTGERALECVEEVLGVDVRGAMGLEVLLDP